MQTQTAVQKTQQPGVLYLQNEWVNVQTKDGPKSHRYYWRGQKGSVEAVGMACGAHFRADAVTRSEYDGTPRCINCEEPRRDAKTTAHPGVQKPPPLRALWSWVCNTFYASVTFLCVAMWAGSMFGILIGWSLDPLMATFSGIFWAISAGAMLWIMRGRRVR